METTTATAAPPVRIGVIGVGRIGRMHAELLARRVEGASVTAVQDAHDGSAQQVGAELDVPVAGSVEELLGAADVDAVAICSSTDTHAALIEAAARAGKAIFCEKPISLELGAVDRALAVVAEAGVPFQIGFNRRFDPGHRTVHDAVRRGVVGDVHLVRITSRDPAPPPMTYVATSGGIFLDMTIHDFDMARYIAGSEVVEVFARGAVRIDPEFAEHEDVDTAVITLVHADGCLTTIDNSRRAVYGYDQRVEAFGSLGVASLGEPAGARGGRAHRGRGGGRRAAVLLPRALPAQLHPRMGGVRLRRGRGRRAAGRRGRRARAARDRARRVALAARGPAGGRGGDRGVSDPLEALPLDGRVLVVTGSTQGLGAAIAHRAAALGAAGIVVCGRDRARGEAVRDALACEAEFVAADLAAVEDCRRIMRGCEERFGRLAAADAEAPLGRLLRPDEDIAPMACHLLSDAAAMVTGSVIDFDQTVLGIPA